MIRLTSSQLDRAKSFVLDLCICSGISSNTRTLEYANFYYCIFNLDSRYARTYKTAADTIMNAIKRRTFNFKEVDRALQQLKEYRASFGETPKSTTTDWTVKNIQTVAKYLAWACAENHIYWNDVAYTPAEREEFVSGSMFGAAIKDAECFATQPTTVVRTRSASTSSAASTSSVGGSTGVAKSGYKGAGPQSANVAGLIGKPGEKTHPVTSGVYCIVGDKAGTIVPNAFIHPVNNSAVGEKARVNAVGQPTIKFGAGNGYTDLTIYSTDKTNMETIFDKLKDKGLFSKYSGVHVAAVKTNAGGYFRVNSEYGEVLVKPTKLNEKLFEEIFEAMTYSEEKNVDLTELTEATRAIEDIHKFVRDSKMYD